MRGRGMRGGERECVDLWLVQWCLGLGGASRRARCVCAAVQGGSLSLYSLQRCVADLLT
jgi:hypothetical protein